MGRVVNRDSGLTYSQKRITVQAATSMEVTIALVSFVLYYTILVRIQSWKWLKGGLRFRVIPYLHCRRPVLSELTRIRRSHNTHSAHTGSKLILRDSKQYTSRRTLSHVS